MFDYLLVHLDSRRVSLNSSLVESIYAFFFPAASLPSSPEALSVIATSVKGSASASQLAPGLATQQAALRRQDTASTSAGGVGLLFSSSLTIPSLASRAPAGGGDGNDAALSCTDTAASYGGPVAPPGSEFLERTPAVLLSLATAWPLNA